MLLATFLRPSTALLFLTASTTAAHAAGEVISVAERDESDRSAVGPAPSRPVAAIEEIVVTAQRREERLQEVPVAVTALSETFLEERGLVSVQNLGAYAPGIKVQESPGNTTSAQIAIRGSVTINPALYWEPAVAIYLDGVYFGKTQGALFEVADLQRIEVLRGPQGTLYGRNTLAGAINLVTSPPSGESTGSVKTSVGNYNLRSVRAVVDLPAVGDFSAKLTGFGLMRDPMYRVAANPYPPVESDRPRPSGLQSADHRGGRVAVRYAPSEMFIVDYAYDYSDADDLPRYGQLSRLSTTDTFSASPQASTLATLYPTGTAPRRGRQEEATVDGESYDRAKIEGHALTGTWSPGGITLKSITAYREMERAAAGDYDGTQLALVPAGFTADYEALSQELQALGSWDAADYVAGVFLFEESGWSGPAVNGNPRVLGLFELDSEFDFRTRAWAAYGQLDYSATPSLKLTAGLRYTREHKELRHHYRFGPGPAQVPPGSGGSKTFSNVSPALIAGYQFTDEINSYVKWARGYKSGGFNGEATSEQAANRPYEAEVLDSYELGVKSTWFERRILVNGAAFLNKSHDMQLSRFDGGVNLGSTIVNAGAATIWGVELETVAQPLEDLQLRLTYSYLRPRYNQYIDTDAQSGAQRDVKDNRAFPLAPRHTAGLGLDWVMLRTPYGLVRLSADADYTDHYYLYPYALDETSQPSARHTRGDERTLFAGRLSLAELPLGSASAEVSLWGRNLFNKEYVATALDLGPGLGGINLKYYGDPRTVGLDLCVRW